MALDFIMQEDTNSDEELYSEEDIAFEEDLGSINFYTDTIYKQILGQLCVDSELLTLEEEQKYTRLYYETRNTKYRDYLFRHNLRLVFLIAKRYAGYNTERLTEYYQEGCIGLLKAIENFNPELGNKLSTYACWWIRQGIVKYIQGNLSIIRLPVHAAEENYAIHRAVDNLSKDGKEYTLADIAQESGVSIERITLLTNTIDILSLDKPVDSEKNSSASIMDNYALEDEHSIEETTLHDDLRTQFRNVFKELNFNAKTIDVVEKRFGFYDGSCWTLQEVANTYGCSKERIRQIEKGAIRAMRSPRAKRLLKGYEDGILC